MPRRAAAFILERLTGQARRALVAAFQEARANHDDYVGTEHVLLGLLGETHAGAGAMLGLLSIDAERLQQQIRLLLQHPARAVGSDHLPLTPGARRALEEAAEAADEARHSHIGPEHLLIGLSRESESLAHFLLAEAGVDGAALQAALGRMPPTENRDQLVQSVGRPGAAQPVDPSLAELEQMLDVFGPNATAISATTRGHDAPWAVEHDALRSQLANTQIAMGAFMGAMVGVTLGPWFVLWGMIFGGLIACSHSSWFGALGGAWAGITLAHYLSPGQPITALLLILCSIVCGIFVGDWPARLAGYLRSNERIDEGEE